MTRRRRVELRIRLRLSYRSSCGPVARAPPSTHHASAGAGERRRANGGEFSFPGRVARHCNAPQWFLQHGSGPAPHGLAGQSACVFKCVGVYSV